MKRISLVIALTFTLLFCAYAQAPRSSRAGQTVNRGEQAKAGRAKQILVKTLPKEIEGLVLENGVFRLQSGYKYVNETKNTVSLVRISNGAVSGTFWCGCVKDAGDTGTASGDCTVTINYQDMSLTCAKSSQNPCNRSCVMSAKRTGAATRLAIF